MTAKEYIKFFYAYPSIKYTGRYDVDHIIDLSRKNIKELPFPFGIVTKHFHCHLNNLTSLYNVPIEVGWDFRCSDNQLTTLEHLPKHIGGSLHCFNNPLQNLNALKDVVIKGYIRFYHVREKQLDYWIKALYNTDLDALEWHYDNHTYSFLGNKILENYITNELEEIIKVKRLKKDLNVP